MAEIQGIPSFVEFQEGERFDREYYVAHTTLRRFPASTLALIGIGFVFFVLPGVLLLVYFSLRKLKISHGFAAVTDKRVIYYERNDHPAENYQHMRSLHVADITGVQFRYDRRWWRRSFWMSLQTQEAAMVVGARGYLAAFKTFGSRKSLEPGPDALEFIQVMSGEVAAMKFSGAGEEDSFVT